MLFLCGLKPFLFWNRNLELKAAHVWKIRWMALVQVTCCPLFRSDVTSWVRSTEDVLTPGGVLPGRGVQLWQSSAQKEGKVGWCVSIWKPVLQQFHACLLEGWKHECQQGWESLWRGSCVALVWEKSSLKLLLASEMKYLFSVVLGLADLCMALPQKSPRALWSRAPLPHPRVGANYTSGSWVVFLTLCCSYRS